MYIHPEARQGVQAPSSAPGPLKHSWSLTLSEAVASSPGVRCHFVRSFVRMIRLAVLLAFSGMKLPVLIHATMNLWEIERIMG